MGDGKTTSEQALQRYIDGKIAPELQPHYLVAIGMIRGGWDAAMKFRAQESLRPLTEGYQPQGSDEIPTVVPRLESAVVAIGAREAEGVLDELYDAVVKRLWDDRRTEETMTRLQAALLRAEATGCKARLHARPAPTENPPPSPS